MSLSLKAELETWAAALKAYDEQDFKKALELFFRIADSSKILTNMGLIYATVGEHETAVEHFVAATNLDPYLAIAHFQCGVSNFLLERYDFALLNFEDAYLYLRGNGAINYDQIGLKFKLFSAEIMFNKGLTQINLGYRDQGMADMREASKLKVTDEHGVIDEAIRDRGVGYTVFSIPVGVLYRPSENKLKNSKSKDYLGKAKLVAACDSNDAFTEFTGVKKLQQSSAENTDGRKDERKTDVKSPTLSRSATVPAPRADSVAARITTLQRSQTIHRGSGVRPNVAAILASRRSQLIPNPANVPPPPFTSDLSRSNITLSSSNATQLAGNPVANAVIMPLRVKTHRDVVTGIASIGLDDSRMDGETGAVPGSRPNLRNPKGQGAPSFMQQSAFQLPPQPLQPGRYTDDTHDLTPLALSSAPVQVQEGHLTQFYNAYMDVYMNEHVVRSTIPCSPTSRLQSSISSSQRQSPTTASSCHQPQPLSQEQQQLPIWMQSACSPIRSNSDATPGMNPAPLRAVNSKSNMGLVMNQNMSKGSTHNASGGPFQRKPVHRQMTCRVRVSDDEDGDDGFVTTEYEEFEMANIRIKLHYQDDVRGMTIPPTTSFKEFVERVTVKFGTSLTGLGMKFADEEGMKISLRDESDFELAIETARENAKGWSEGKMDVWCVDV